MGLLFHPFYGLISSVRLQTLSALSCMWAASGGVGDRQEAMTYGQRVETVMLDCLLVIQKLYKHATIAERQQEQSMF